MTGLAGMLTSGKGAGTSTGITAGAKVVPSSYALVSELATTTYTVRMALRRRRGRRPARSSRRSTRRSTGCRFSKATSEASSTR